MNLLVSVFKLVSIVVIVDSLLSLCVCRRANLSCAALIAAIIVDVSLEVGCCKIVGCLGSPCRVRLVELEAAAE